MQPPKSLPQKQNIVFSFNPHVFKTLIELYLCPYGPKTPHSSST